ncbi:LytTR family DNA-binding domain-containing protein [Prolixibacter sp. NT017]|uniref:LytR/AlgR family response regulator transcription factor n=1 Tax=Prolixibacter sp. NT017 TaxID=2652390 RepID=UPI0012889C3C|nr:LytTR family DNA-binding domain-containing protein [Prolixibacter sp. NT017]GET24517.1 DNA-binding response regulator [Prolixibacter sp. NT017]
MKIRCLIVDDEPLARAVLRDHIRKIDFLELAGECRNALEATSEILKGGIDLVFLDINMPVMSGIELAKQIKEMPTLIFTTAYSEHALEGFELDAVDYLVKPITFNRFVRAVNKAVKWLSRNDNSLKEMEEAKESVAQADESFAYFKVENKMVRLMLADIIAAESQGHYVKIYTAKENHLVYQSISQLEERLPSGIFIRCHRSFIINIRHIRAMTYHHIETDILKVPIGRSYKASVQHIIAK